MPRKLRGGAGGEDGRRDAALGRVDESEVSPRLVIPVSHLALVRTAPAPARLSPHVHLIHGATTAHPLLPLRDKVRQESHRPLARRQKDADYRVHAAAD